MTKDDEIAILKEASGFRTLSEDGMIDRMDEIDKLDTFSSIEHAAVYYACALGNWELSMKENDKLKERIRELESRIQSLIEDKA